MRKTSEENSLMVKKTREFQEEEKRSTTTPMKRSWNFFKDMVG